ncbi:uncharacterized protein METZ01_LOCUS95723, partial [marine metagenome]
MRAVGIVLILVLNFLSPSGLATEETPIFEVTFFDQNADGIDDRMDFLINEKKDVAVILMLSTRPSELHLTYIKDIGLAVTH